MCAQFREVFEDSGFTLASGSKLDPDPFHVLPVEGVRYVALLDGKGLNVMSLSPRVCQIDEIAEAALPPGPRIRNTGAAANVRYFRLRSYSAGPASILADSPKTGTQARLMVIVKRRLQVRLAVHHVRDKAGHSAKRPVAQVSKWMQEVNRIWLNRAMVQVILHATSNIVYPGDLGAAVAVSSSGAGGMRDHPLAGYAMQDVDLNVFLVWRMKVSGGAGGEMALTTLSGKPGLCFLQDHAGRFPAVVLAHEIGHHLGLNHTGHTTGQLMAETDVTMSSDPLLTKIDLIIANP